MRSVHVAVSWLRSLLVHDHLVLEANEKLLHGVLWVPVLEHVEGLLNLAVVLVNAWKVNFGGELDLWWNHWVLITANDGHIEDPVVKVGVLWTNDYAIPVCETFIVTYYI